MLKERERSFEMEHTGLLTISDFAELSRTTRDTLLHYDRFDLLKPAYRGENNYRYYSKNQIELVDVIRTLQKLGMTLEEIKEVKDRRTPELAEAVFREQIEIIDKKIDDWVRARKLLLTLQKIISSVSDIDENVITIQFMPAEAIVLGDINDYSRGRTVADALLSFYRDMSSKYPDLDIDYPVWGTFSQEQIKRGECEWPDRFYFFNPEGHDRRHAGLYALGYTRGWYGKNNQLFVRMKDFIEKNGYEICGDAYEEYPLNEFFLTEIDNYLVKAIIPVREKR